MSVILLNGRGQIGTMLKRLTKSINTKEDVYVYHTWNIDDKKEETQKQEYNKFRNFVRNNEDKRIVFISTSSQSESPYVRYKQISESFLIQNCDDCLVIRIPTLVGKGVFKDFKNKIKIPYGEMKIMTIKEACDVIIHHLDYKGYLKTLTFEGHKIDAKLVYEMVTL